MLTIEKLTMPHLKLDIRIHYLKVRNDTSNSLYFYQYRTFLGSCIEITNAKIAVFEPYSIGSHDKRFRTTRLSTIKTSDKYIQVGQGISLISLHIHDKTISIYSGKNQISVHHCFKVKQGGTYLACSDKGILVMVADKYPIQSHHPCKTNGNTLHMHIHLVILINTIHYPCGQLSLYHR